MKTVLKALAQVQADIAKQGISKSQENTYDKYKFRGIDDVLNALAPIFAKHGVVLVPSVEESKACTAAYKYFLFQALCIPVQGTPDADSESHEVSDIDPRKAAHDAAFARHHESVSAIQQAIANGELSAAYEAWNEIPAADKEALWLAPTKGGCFTTAERATMKSNEWHEVSQQFYGDAA